VLAKSALVAILPGKVLNHAPAPHWPPTNSQALKLVPLAPVHANDTGLPLVTVEGTDVKEVSVVGVETTTVKEFVAHPYADP
jgi:hypothetical protein